MGEVYEALDTRLGRRVALKVLPEDLARDPERKRRLEREARTVASLDHPHICILHDIGRAVPRGPHASTLAIDFLVMELLEGETLESRLRRGALPVEEALGYGIEIADALDKAHGRGVVHRDLKPGNVMLTKTGAKLLDFGIAKVAPDSEVAAAVPDSLTLDGAILGTPQYMAPEQLRGAPVDARTDLFALGAVLYEGLTGKKAFPGDSPASIIATVLDAEPDDLTPWLPTGQRLLDRVVRTCLAKDPDDRWQSARDLRRELQWIASGAADAPPERQVRAVSARRWAGGAALAVFVIGVAIGGLAVWGGRQQEDRSATHVTVGVEPADRLFGGPRTGVVLSPDGRRLVFVGAAGRDVGLYVRELDQPAARLLAGTSGAASPFLSPDGGWVGFWSAGQLKKIPIGGGPIVVLCASENMGATWGPNGTVVFAQITGGLWQVSADGGTPTPLTALDVDRGEVSHRLPHFLPGGGAIVFTVRYLTFGGWAGARVAVQSLDTGVRRFLLDNATDARFVSSGHLVYARAATLMAVPFNVDTQELSGPAVGVVDGVRHAINLRSTTIDSGAAAFSVAGESLAYIPGGVAADLEHVLVWADRSGNLESLPLPARPYVGPRLSPTGDRIGFSTLGANRGVWVHDLQRGSTSLLNAGGDWAVWTPDGEHITYGFAESGPRTLFWRPADGSGPAERLTTTDTRQTPVEWSRAGDELLFVRGDGDIWALARDDDTWTPRPLIETAPREVHPALSPDGAWLAYTSDESGQQEVYILEYPGLGIRHQISIAGGYEPAWAPDNRELFYFVPPATLGSPEQLMVVDIPAGSAGRPSRPRALFSLPRFGSSPSRNYDVSGNGQRLLLVQQSARPAEPPVTHINLVLDWFAELERLAPAS
jgi:serine/threonine-protein kinase